MDQKKRVLIIISILGVFVLITLSMFVNAQPLYSMYSLIEGKNVVAFSEPGFASDVLKNHQEIESISYFDVRANTTIGYVRALGGIGKNFLIVPGEPYEIFVNQNMTLAL